MKRNPIFMADRTSWYTSSKGSGLSMTLGGFSLEGLAELISSILTALGVDADASVIGTSIRATVDGVAGVMVLFGLLRKGFFAVRR